MKLLLVEDDPGIARFVQRGLRGEGYEVDWQRNMSEARASLGTGAYSVAILDRGLPDGDGADLCRAVRSDGIQTPIIMLTARSALHDKLDGFGSGADDYLAKPFAFDELVARLAAVVRRAGARTSVSFGALRMDLSRRELRIGVEPLHLSPREFDLLAALARGRGDILSREHLIEHAWSGSAEVSDNAVDVYIGYLRRALRDYPRAPDIETCRGQGFRLVLKHEA